jgi:hypothetical protein
MRSAGRAEQEMARSEGGAMIEQKTLCEGCGKEIDQTLCGCGELIADHHMHCNHGPVPMGCDCFRERKEQE